MTNAEKWEVFIYFGRDGTRVVTGDYDYVVEERAKAIRKGIAVSGVRKVDE